MSDSIVSICCLAYNHGPYIRQCLEGFVMQKTNFTFEVLIHDDASTDETAKIIKEFEDQHPILIKPIYQSENQFSKGISPTFTYNFPRARGKYIALCEGDDYWTDPYKLQKQIDFLEANPEYGICAHRVQSVNEFDTSKNHIFPNNSQSQDYYIKQFIQSNVVATCSLIFKKEYFNSKPWHQKSPFGDLLLTLTVLKNSNQKMYVLYDVMGVYRIHSGGVHGNFHQSNKGLVKAYEQHLQFNELIKKYLLFEKKYKSFIQSKKVETYRTILTLLDKKLFWFKYAKYKCLLKINTL